jgi:pyruvate-formate lyase
MPFSKAFPKTMDGISYPKWIEIFLSKEQETQVELQTSEKNKQLMIECISDAKDIVQKANLRDYQSDLISIAVALFEKRSSHQVYAKERACKDIFDRDYNQN